MQQTQSLFAANTDEQYSRHVANLIKNGVSSGDRTGTGTQRLNGLQFRFDLREGFPMVTTKKVSFGYIAKELEWIASGNTSQRALKDDLNCSIWDEWADELGRLGPVYGAMWRRRPAAHISMVKVPMDMRKGVVLTTRKVQSAQRGYTAEQMASPVFKIWLRILNAVLARSNVDLFPNKEIPEVYQRTTIAKEWLDFDVFRRDFEILPGSEMAINSSFDTWAFHTTNNGNGIWAKDTLCFVETYKLALLNQAKYLTTLDMIGGVTDVVTTPRFYIDQLAEAIEDIKNDSESRRIIVDSWEPSLLPAKGVKPDKQPELGLMALAPCHCMFQFTAVEIGGKKHLSVHLTQRSADYMLGIPYNIASYALLLEVIAREVGMVAHELVLTTVDSHIYKNHIETAKKQIRRKCRILPKLVIDPSVKKLSDFKRNLVRLENYEHGPKTDYPVAV